jgi:hypothetical protein
MGDGADHLFEQGFEDCEGCGEIQMKCKCCRQCGERGFVFHMERGTVPCPTCGSEKERKP